MLLAFRRISALWIYIAVVERSTQQKFLSKNVPRNFFIYHGDLAQSKHSLLSSAKLCKILPRFVHSQILAEKECAWACGFCDHFLISFLLDMATVYPCLLDSASCLCPLSVSHQWLFFNQYAVVPFYTVLINWLSHVDWFSNINVGHKYDYFGASNRKVTLALLW